MQNPSLTERIERRLRENELYIVAEEAGNRIVLSGRVRSPKEKDSVWEIVGQLVSTDRIDDNIEVETREPVNVNNLAMGDARAPDLEATEEERAAATGDLEPDFTDQELTVNTKDVVQDADRSGAEYFPPTDPVTRPDARGDAEFVGGFTPTSTTSQEVDRSALDGQPGDEALIDAVKRELREDALTSDLDIQVDARNGVVRLRGRVGDMTDAEAAEEVAGRVPGVREVREELEVPQM